jgi:uncharacterized lipoprotein YddW (UPF0748 family)
MKKTILFFVAITSLLMACEEPSLDKNYIAEARAVWMSANDADDWDSTMAALSKAGFNLVIPNMFSSGSAYFPSQYVPMISEKDELALLLEAAHKYGIEVHVWKVNWALWQVNEDALKKYEEENRIQISYDQKRVPQVSKELGWNQRYDWLCPSHPENREMEKNLMMEVVRKYDIDGVHFDYMRYPYEPLCYCITCKEKFAQETGLPLENWPADVWKGGKYREIYLDWRRELITSSARDIAAAIHAYDPYVCVSLAARSGLEHAYNSDAQVWWKWDDEGILDFVCPMNYSDKPSGYIQSIREHYPLVKGSIPYYGGIGLFRMRDAPLLIEAIEGGRKLGQDGFTIFSYGWGGLRERLDTVSAYLGNKEFILLPHRGPEVSYYFRNSRHFTEEGFPLYENNETVHSEVVIMMKGKLKQGISRIYGDFRIQDMDRKIIMEIEHIDLTQSKKLNLRFSPGNRGRFHLALAGYMELSDGQKKPFISKSFPFEIR